MINCDISKGFTRACKNLVGGTRNAILLNWIENPFTVVDGEATAINTAITQAFKYELDSLTSNFTESIAGDRASGTTVNTQTVTLVIHGLSADKSNEFTLLTKGYPIVIIEDNMGRFFALGIEDGIDFTTVSATGSAKGDANGYTLTGVSTTQNLAPQLKPEVVTELLALITA